MIKYRVYPSLLDDFQRYEAGKIELQALLNRINRIRDFDDKTLARMKKGSNFEKAVIKNDSTFFEKEIIEEVRSLLPQTYSTQYLARFNYKNIQLSGYADIVGHQRIIDIKTTSNLNLEKYKNSYQNLYLYSLKDKGCLQMEYIIYNFEKVSHLVLPLAEMDFRPWLEGLERFAEFLENHRKLISDKKIFVAPTSDLFFSELFA